MYNWKNDDICTDKRALSYDPLESGNVTVLARTHAL